MAANHFPEFNVFKLVPNNFPRDEVAIDFCERFQLIPTVDYPAIHANCPYCSSPMNPNSDISIKIGWRLRYVNTLCGKSWNPLEGTWFERVHLTWVQVMNLIFCFVTKIMPSLQFACNVTNCSAKTSVDWWNLMRQVCTRYVDNDTQIGGPMLTVEIEETHLYVAKYHHGAYPEDVWVNGGICRETKEVFVERVEDRTRYTLDGIIGRRVAPGSIIITDGWAAYRGLMDRFGLYEREDEGFVGHFVVIHEEGFVAPPIIIPSLNGTPGLIEVHTNTIESTWCVLKKNIKSIQEHIDELGVLHRMVDTYTYRFFYFRNILNNIDDNGQRFRRLLEDIREMYPFNNAECFYQPIIRVLLPNDSDSDTEIDDDPDFGVLTN